MLNQETLGATTEYEVTLLIKVDDVDLAEYYRIEGESSAKDKRAKNKLVYAIFKQIKGGYYLSASAKPFNSEHIGLTLDFI